LLSQYKIKKDIKIKMKILMVRSTNAIGGAEICNLNLIKGFKKYYLETKLFFITTLSEFGKRIEAAGAKVIVLPVFSEEVGTKRGLLRLFWSLPKYLYFYLKTILKLKRKEKINLICLQSATEKITLTPFLKLFGFKVVWIEHGPFFSFPTAKEVFFLYRVSSYLPTKIIAVSKNTKLDSIKGGFPVKRITCVVSGIDSDYFSPLTELQRDRMKSRLFLRKKDGVIGYMGSICREKGIEKLLEVGKLVIGKMKNIKFLIVGDGPMLNYAKKFIKDSKLEKKFLFTGFQRGPKCFLGIFDVIFYPTVMGSISMTLMEAMAIGIPVVTRDIGGNRELVVHGKTGYLFKDETPEELADLIIKLLKDSQKRKRMGVEARKRIVKYFNLKKWVTEMHQTFKEVTNE